ncbi:leucine-rich repeat-containing protein 66-like [Gracilinanus agilis]|uniref:leucine-rich repeat-containing protein 66-like n=1 Tax=Gracilinanus agilis TaxID=191870 RepID=UPI001CFE35A3|nr:leucine-rich repeat-containing protein 66-like [Gracilinanus agilis]
MTAISLRSVTAVMLAACCKFGQNPGKELAAWLDSSAKKVLLECGCCTCFLKPRHVQQPHSSKTFLADESSQAEDNPYMSYADGYPKHVKTFPKERVSNYFVLRPNSYLLVPILMKPVPFCLASKPKLQLQTDHMPSHLNHQIVNLSINALTTILPMMFIALTLPHLDADLSNNQWQCDCNMSVFQNFISESWRKRWNTICNESIGENETYWWTPYKRISENTQIPHISLNQMKKLVISKAEKPLEGLYVCFSTSGRKKHIMYEISVKQEHSPRWVRRAREILASTREATTSQDLTLAVCLSVIITFCCAFGLGAFSRPYMDRLWQQRCQTKSSVSENAYSNEGFYDDVGIMGNPKPLSEIQHQDSSSMYEDTEAPDLYASVTDDGKPRASIRGKDCGQSRGRATPEDWERNENRLPNHRDARSIDSEDMNVIYDDVITIKRELVYGNDILRELARGDSFYEDPRRTSSVDKILQKDPGSFQSHSSELDRSLSRERIFPLPQVPTHPKAQNFEETGEIDGAAHMPSEVIGAQKGFPKETQLNSSWHPLTSQQQRHSRSSSGPQYRMNDENRTILSDNPRDFYLSSPFSSWENDSDVDHSSHDPTPIFSSDHQKQEPNSESINDDDVVTHDSFDSDEEGSLFTLSSSGSEDDWNSIQEQPHDERDHGATCPSIEQDCVNKDSSDRMDYTQSENPGDDASIQKTVDKGENEKKEHSENIISRLNINLSETDLPTYQISSNSKTRTQESPPNSAASSPVSVEIPGMFIYDHVLTLSPEPSEWHHSWGKQEQVSTRSSSPQQTSFMCPEDPLDSESNAAQIYKYSYMQISDNVKKEILPEINPEEKLKNS